MKRIASLFDDAEVRRSTDECISAAIFRATKARLLRTLACLPVISRSGICCCGLARRVSCALLRDGRRIPLCGQAPRGWRFEYDVERDMVTIMPAWLYWIRHLPVAIRSISYSRGRP